ncbi:MAG: hypothetical protein ACPGQS_14645, partial [Bradymonadia bacterium]
SGSPLPIIRKRHMGRIVLWIARALSGDSTPMMLLDHDFNRECSAHSLSGQIEISRGGETRSGSSYQAMESYLFEQRDAMNRSSTYQEKEKIANRA